MKSVEGMREAYRQQAENEQVTLTAPQQWMAPCIYLAGWISESSVPMTPPPPPFTSSPTVSVLCGDEQRMVEHLEAIMQANGVLHQEVEDAQEELAITREEADILSVEPSRLTHCTHSLTDRSSSGLSSHPPLPIPLFRPPTIR